MVFDVVLAVLGAQVPDLRVCVRGTTYYEVVVFLISEQRAHFDRVAFQAEVYCVCLDVLLSVFKSQTLMEPRLEPTTTC